MSPKTYKKKVYKTRRAARMAANKQAGYQIAYKTTNGYTLRQSKPASGLKYRRNKIAKGIYRTKGSATVAANMRGGTEGIKKIRSGKYKGNYKVSSSKHAKAARKRTRARKRKATK